MQENANLAVLVVDPNPGMRTSLQNMLGLAGIAGQSLVINLPGSVGGARDGMAVVVPLLGHALAQLRGHDHRQRPSGPES